MAHKSIPLSFRVSDEDAEFLSRLDLPGASTPSEKLRVLIGEARRRAGNDADYAGCLREAQALLEPVRAQLREAELKTDAHSELVMQTLDWLPELLAFVMASARRSVQSEPDSDRLKALEQGLAERIARMASAQLRLGITEQEPNYDPKVVKTRLDPVLDVAEFLLSKRRRDAGEGG